MARDQRRLAAIVSADVAGYSRLMGRDESGTLAALKAHRLDLIDPKIAEYGGRIVKTTGDGLLLEFPSVVDAVRCAVDVQRNMAERNASTPTDQRIDFRIGINVGDIIIDGDDIFGDGVNVAARLQALAEPGGICVSKVVRDQVVDKLSFTFVELGAQQVKNIARPVEIYCVNLASGDERSALSRRWSWQIHRVAWHRWLAGVLVLVVAGAGIWTLLRAWKTAPAGGPPVMSIAILPLNVPTDDVDVRRFAETFARNLTTELPRKREYGSVYVVAGLASSATANGTFDAREVGRRLSVRYLLEGDVSRGRTGNVINLRLVEAMTGGQVWSERDTLHDTDVIGESTPNMRNLGARLRSVLIGIEGQRVSALPISNLSARELVLRAFEAGGKDGSKNGLVAAGSLVDEALRLDPDLVPALVLRSALLNNQADLDPHIERERVAREQDQLTARAVRLDAQDPAAWNWRSVALGYLGRWDAALDANALAVKLDPYEPRWLVFRASLMAWAGRPVEALTIIDQAFALEPSNQGLLMEIACEARLLVGQSEQAIAACEKASGYSNAWYVRVLLTAAYANHGDMEKAAVAKAEVLHAVPSLTIAQLREKSPRGPEASNLANKYIYNGLRKTGFPEQ